MLDLNYDYKTGTLTASSVDFLVIRNNALGYKLQYLLSNFTLNNSDPADKSFSFAGSVLFEELEGSPSQKKEWQAMRQKVYEGSQMHFLQSALHDRLDQDGFRVQRLPLNPERPADSLIASKIKVFTLLKKDDKRFRDSLSYWEKKYKLPKFQQKLSPFPLTVQDLVSPSSQKVIYALGCSYDAMYVTYNKYHRFGKNLPERLSDPGNTDNTLVIFNEPTVFFDSNGTVINPGSLTYDGVWLRGRIAGLLPLDYEPQQNGDFIAGETVLQTLSAKLTTYTAANITEKAYLHFDKPYYAAGDTIYFKTYVTEGGQHTPSAISKVLYVDLVNDKNKITRSLVLNLNEGLAWGDIALPDTVKQGNYYIRAYTNYMRNAGEAYFLKSLSRL